MRVIAIASIGAAGHVVPKLGLARRLVSRGVTVKFLTTERYRAAVEHVGAEFVGYDSIILTSGAPRRLNGFKMGHIPATVAQEAVATTPQLVRILEAAAPDLLLYDAFTHAALFAGEAVGVRMVRHNTSYSLAPWFNYFDDTAAGRLPGVMASPEGLAAYDELMAPLFRRYHVRPRTFHDLMVEPAGQEIVSLPRAFHPFSDRYGPNVTFVGSVADEGCRLPPPHETPGRGGYPRLIFVSLGTVFNFQPAFFYACLEAFGSWDARVVLCVGDTFPPDFWADVPPNVVIRPSVDQLAALREADLFLTHAGLGGVLEAFDRGTPMLAIPQYPEQLVTARRVAELGAGLLLDREQVSIASLREAARRLLEEDHFRARARAIGEASRRDGGSRRACDVLLGPPKADGPSPLFSARNP